MQFDGFLSVLEQKGLENHEIYYIEAAEQALGFQHCAPLLGWKYLNSITSKIAIVPRFFINYVPIVPKDGGTSSSNVPKGQLISKGLFFILNSPKKRTKKFDFTTMIPQQNYELISRILLINNLQKTIIRTFQLLLNR